MGGCIKWGRVKCHGWPLYKIKITEFHKKPVAVFQSQQHDMLRTIAI